MDVAFVWQRKGEASNPKNTVATGKRGGSIMLWGYFAASGTGNRVHVHGIMKKGYVVILKDTVKKSAASRALGRRWIFSKAMTRSIHPS